MLIGICGKAASGKSTIAEALESRLGFAEVSLTAPMKRAAADWFSFTDDQLYGESRNRNEPDMRWIRADGTGLTPRQFLQTLGTEVARKCHPDVWIRRALESANFLLEERPGVVIPDVRFRNEVDAIKAAGGKVIRLTRGDGLEGEAGRHASETEQSGIPDEVFDYVLENRFLTVGGSQAAAVEIVRGWMR